MVRLVQVGGADRSEPKFVTAIKTFKSFFTNTPMTRRTFPITIRTSVSTTDNQNKQQQNQNTFHASLHYFNTRPLCQKHRQHARYLSKEGGLHGMEIPAAGQASESNE
jgi:hypothetical protein